MSYNKVLTIQDISCVGQCSLTVALPILSACGLETVILPTAVLSNHTAKGFSGFTFRDLTDDIPLIRKRWEEEGITFKAIYTGYLGSVRQVGMIEDIFDSFGGDDCRIIVDPAMADNGSLYTGFDAAYVEAMKRLVARAEYVLPNITEASFLTGEDYLEQYDRAYVDLLADKLQALGARNVIMTGVGFEEGTTGVMIRTADGEDHYYPHSKYPEGRHGTGDIYASAFVGAMMQGHDAVKAASIAAEFTRKCIGITIGTDHWYGAMFEQVLPELAEMIK